MSETAAPVKTSLRAMLPREHGAYFQLLLPVLAGLVLARGAAGGWWLCGAAVATFLMHEPLVVLLGQRGERRLRRDTRVARTCMTAAVGVGTACLALGAFTIGSEARVLLALPLVLGAQLLLAVLGGQERTTSGELLAVLALSAWASPVAAAGGVPTSQALLLWGFFSVVFIASTLAVRAVLAARRPGAPRQVLRAGTVGLNVAVLVAAALVFTAMPSGSLLPLALLPGGLVSLAVAGLLPSTKHLMRVGWTLAAGTAASAAAVVVVWL